MVNIGALNQPLEISPLPFMSTARTYRGSNWFTVAQGEEMVALADAGVVDYEFSSIAHLRSRTSTTPWIPPVKFWAASSISS